MTGGPAVVSTWRRGPRAGVGLGWKAVKGPPGTKVGGVLLRGSRDFTWPGLGWVGGGLGTRGARGAGPGERKMGWGAWALFTVSYFFSSAWKPSTSETNFFFFFFC